MFDIFVDERIKQLIIKSVVDLFQQDKYTFHTKLWANPPRRLQ